MERSDPPASSTVSGWVLVVDDNSVNRALTLLQLERLGYRAKAVTDADAAVEAAAGGEFALVLMDCQMPEVDGLEATRRIRLGASRTGAARIPIIALTASATESDRQASLAAEMDDFVTKPLSLETLRDVLTRWLPGDGPAARAREEPAGQGVVRSGAIVPPELCADLGAEAAYRFVETYLTALPTRLDAAIEAIRASDMHALGQTMHVLRPSSAAVGAQALEMLCSEIEDSARSGSLSDLDGTIDRIAETGKATADGLRGWLETGGFYDE